LMPIPMIAAGISRMHQKSSEFLRRGGLVKRVVAFMFYIPLRSFSINGNNGGS
jgi:hypothetical protein